MQYNLSLEDVSICKTKNAKSNQLAFGVMLSFFKIYTQFPLDKEFTISSQLILQVVNNLGIDLGISFLAKIVMKIMEL